MTMLEQRHAPSPRPDRPERRAMSLSCTLRRSAGTPIAARTLDVGPTGMRVVTGRPLAVDETVAFELPCGDVRISGQSRVVCQERPDVYALRFARLSQPMARCLHDVVAAQAPAA
jgi:hypothetical protein